MLATTARTVADIIIVSEPNKAICGKCDDWFVVFGGRASIAAIGNTWIDAIGRVSVVRRCRHMLI